MTSHKVNWLERNVVPAALPYFTLCTTVKQFHNELRMLGISNEHYPSFLKTEKAHATVHTLDSPNGGTACIVCLSDKWRQHTPIEVAGLLVHEAVHIYQAYLNNIKGYEFNTELEAYYIQHISQALFEEFVEQTK